MYSNQEIIQILRGYAGTQHPGKMGGACVVDKFVLKEAADRLDELAGRTKPQRILIDLPNGLKLIAEQNADPYYKNELFIGIMTADGVWHQDLAVVRNSYSHNKYGEVDWKDGEFDVLVYADKDNEDFTDDFTISLYRDDI